MLSPHDLDRGRPGPQRWICLHRLATLGLQVAALLITLGPKWR